MTTPDLAHPLTTPEAIVRRRATRKFDPTRPLPDDTLLTILRLATHAPSGYNLQPWRFVVVRSDANRRILRACAFNQAELTDAPVAVIVLGALFPHHSHLDPMVETMLRLGSLRAEGAAEMRARCLRTMERVTDRALWATRSATFAAATLLLAAESVGVASAPMEGFDPARVREAFGVPDDHTVCCLVALGYAAEVPAFPGRFGLGEVCYEEHFGQPWTLGDLPLDPAPPPD